MADVQALVGRIRIVPNLRARPRINRPDVIGYREVQNSVRDERRRFDLGRLAGLKRPDKG